MLERPADRCRLTGGQQTPTERAVAARSARKSPGEEDAEEEEARSTDEEDRLLTKRCIERQWKTRV